MDSVDSRIPSNPSGYHDTGEHAYKERTLATYAAMLFRDSSKRWFAQKPDTMTPDDPMQWSMRHYHKIAHYFSNNDLIQTDSNITYDWDWPEYTVFGGYDGFFSPKTQILDLGSGHGQVVQEINSKFKDRDISCVGVDYRYVHDRPADGINLVGADFKALPFPDKSFNRLLSVESFPAWLPKDKTLIDRYLDEITRISEAGTLWRGTLPSSEDDRDIPTVLHEELFSMFVQRGWELVIDQGNNSFTAKLSQRDDKAELITGSQATNS